MLFSRQTNRRHCQHFFLSSLSVPPGQFVLEKRQTSDEVDRRGRATSKGRQTEPPADPVQANALLTLLPSVNVAAAATATQVAATAATSAATETSDSWRGGAVAAQPKAVVVQSHNNSDSQLGQSFNGFSYFFFVVAILPWTQAETLADPPQHSSALLYCHFHLESKSLPHPSRCCRRRIPYVCFCHRATKLQPFTARLPSMNGKIEWTWRRLHELRE